MKKVILLIAIVFATSTFASNNAIDINKKLTLEKPVDLEMNRCQISIKGTYDGKKIDVVITVEADNCAKAAGALLKEFTK